MMRFSLKLFFAFIALQAVLATVSGQSQSLFEGRRSLIILKSTDHNELLKTRDIVEKSGGHITHLFPPNILQGYLTEKAEKELQKTGWIKTITDKSLPAGEKEFSSSERLALTTWNSTFVKTLVTRDGEPKGKQDHNTVKAPDLENTNNKFVLRGQKNFYLTSEYMMGSIAVGIVFVESNGQLDKKTETWTDEDKEDALNQIYKGLDWWAEIGGYKAGLSWTYEIQSLKTPYEPIHRTKDESILWIKDCIGQLGYKNDEDYTLNREYANDLRDKYQTDWAYVIYIVPATNDDDGYFADKSGIAWAYLGGPYMVISNQCNGWGFNQVWKVVAHETGHIFNALDEYKGSSGFSDKSGRLNVINGNHEEGGKKDPCLMKSNELVICEYTLGQIGWIDENADGNYDSDYLNISKKFNADQLKKESLTFIDAKKTKLKTSTRYANEDRILYSDDFSQKNGWYQDEYNFVKDNAYHMYDPEYGNSSWIEKPYSDFDASVKTNWTEGSSVSGYGLMFRIFGPNDGYIFFINGDGQFCAGKYLYGNWSYLHDWERSDAIKLNGENTLRVRGVGSSFSLFINDREVATINDSTFTKGNIGLAVLPEVHVTFDDFLILKP